MPVPLVAKTPRQPPPPPLASGWMIEAMFLHGGKCLCVLCGVEIDISPYDRSLVTIVESSGRRPIIRTVMLGNRELHACAIGTSWEQRAERERHKRDA